MEGWALIFTIKYHRRNQPGVRSLQNSPLGLVTRSFPLSSTLTLAPPTGWPAFQNNCQIAVEPKKKDKAANTPSVTMPLIILSASSRKASIGSLLATQCD